MVWWTKIKFRTSVTRHGLFRSFSVGLNLIAAMGWHACGGFREFLHCRHSDVFQEFFQLVSRKRFEEAERNGKTRSPLMPDFRAPVSILLGKLKLQHVC